MADYLLTARFFSPQRELARLQEKYGLEHMAGEAVLPMLEVHADYLQRALGVIDETYGSPEVYLESVLGVGPAERAELRRRYLGPGEG